MDILTDAFRPIARDGAGNLEVVLRLLKGLGTLAALGEAAFTEAALRLIEEVEARAETVMEFDIDRATVREAAAAARDKAAGVGEATG